MGLLFGKRGEGRGAGNVRCPYCGSQNVERTGEHLVPMPGQPFPQLGETDIVPMTEYRCRDCGRIWDDPF